MPDIAIVGAGPSGFYTAEALLNANAEIRVDLIDRLPTPFGLVRAGVAPDHQQTKRIAVVFDRIASNPRLRLIGNTPVGSLITIAQLLEHYHGVVVAIGATDDRQLGISGEDLPGSLAATEFVGWYNGHPECVSLDIDLTHHSVVIVGLGNVAADICRILSRPIDMLRSTDIARHALDQLAESKVRVIHMVGRKGPSETRFTSPELKELGNIPGTVVRLAEDMPSSLPCILTPAARRNVDIFRSFSERRSGNEGKTIEFRFFERPVAVLGRSRVSGVRLASTLQSNGADGKSTIDLPCGLLIRSAGTNARPFPGLPLDKDARNYANDRGRVVANGARVDGLYVAGWAKRGASGTIGSNRSDAIETSSSVLTDLPALRTRPVRGADSFRQMLADQAPRPTNYSDWKAIDAVETRRGLALGKPREKIVSINEMLACCDDLDNDRLAK